MNTFGKTVRSRLVIIAYFVMMEGSLLHAQKAVSAFNGLALPDTMQSYSFIVSGHFYGSSESLSGYPASTLLAGIDSLNALQPSFIMSLGDMFMDVDQDYITRYEKSLFSKLRSPLFNAVGNHDLSNGNMYEKIYGKTFYSFGIKGERFIVLDAEMDDGSIKGAQLDFLKDALSVRAGEPLENIFIFSHRPVWAEEIPKYGALFPGNTRSEGGNNFKEEIIPLLNEVPEEVKVFWISGSLGKGKASLFCDKDEGTGVTFMQSAIRDQLRDAVLLVQADKGRISFKGVSLTGQDLLPVEAYGVEFWKEEALAPEEFNYRLLPLYIKKMLGHYFFWTGAAASFLFGLLILFFYRRRKRRL